MVANGGGTSKASAMGFIHGGKMLRNNYFRGKMGDSGLSAMVGLW